MKSNSPLLIPMSILLVFFALLSGKSQGQDSANISLLYHWEDESLDSSSIYRNIYNEVWGFVQDGKEYAVIGSTMGTHILDVSKPDSAYEVDFIPGADQGSSIVHRDFHDHQGHLYMVCDEGESTLQIADLSPLPDSVELVYDSDQILRRSHNIFIDSSRSRLYACDAEDKYNSSSSVSILSIDTPDSPTLLREYNQSPDFHDIYVRNDTAYGNHGTDAGLIVYDMSDPNNIDELGTLPTYSDQGYNHSGWLSPSGSHYVMADESHGMRMKMLEVSDLSNIKEEALFFSGVDEESIVHNPLIHDEHVYVAHYHDGVYIWNISDPSNPVMTGFYDTYPPSDHDSYRGAWGVYPFLPSGILLASDMQSGLFVLDVDSAMSALSMKEFENELQVRLYPTVTTDRIHLNFATQPETPLELEILDIQGRRVLHRTIHEPRKEMTWDLDRMTSNGVHFIRGRTDKKQFTEKFVKR